MTPELFDRFGALAESHPWIRSLAILVFALRQMPGASLPAATPPT